MDIRYLDWKKARRHLGDRFRFLKKIFSYLLVREDGNVERALEILEQIGDRHGLFDDEFSFEDFKEQLFADRLVVTSDGGLALTPKGERMVRTSALDAIFSGLKVGREGEHRTPYGGQGAERLAETRPYSFGDEISDIDFPRSFQNTLLRTAGIEMTLNPGDYVEDGLTGLLGDLELLVAAASGCTAPYAHSNGSRRWSRNRVGGI